MFRKRPNSRFRRFVKDVRIHTPFNSMVLLLIALWLLFSIGLYHAENGQPGSSVNTFGEALYWSIAAFSTAGIANSPVTAMGLFIGGTWIVLGSLLFFGSIVATVTTYFMRPMQGPHKKIIDTIEYNLEQLENLNIDELDLLKETVDSLIVHVEHLKEKQREK